ncbi:hypothetical protein [Bradyrhizobium sp. ORS 285]|uniref:hypothetical protein n=1 Tax=Bradyrhizobium sp. ORS 285 TaxID=115808 RepID=UPI0012FC1915|nr:hypothetical protein [Bradyrhizobium sp. ORS 285]
MIKFSMDGKALDPRNLKDAVMASALESVGKQIREKLGNVRDPDLPPKFHPAEFRVRVGLQ